MLNADTLTGQRLIVGFIRLCQLAPLGFLNWQLTLVMKFLNPLIALILEAFGICMEVNPRGLKDLETVLTTGAKERTDNCSGCTLNDELAFERMALLFARVKSPLLPFGTFNQRFRHIHHHHIRAAKASQEGFLAG